MAKAKKNRRGGHTPTGKSRIGDYALATDENAPLGERTSALFRLAVDNDPRVLPLAREWLTRPEGHLREEAIGRLLFGMSQGALDIATTALSADPDPSVRGGVAVALGGYLRLHPDTSQAIGAALAERVRKDDDSIVQRTCYEVLVQQFGGPTRRIHFDFDPTTHVDWGWLDQVTASNAKAP